MNTLPFTLKIQTSSPPGRREEVVCRNVLRALEGTRMVYDATCNGRRVVVKIFTKWGKARYHALREWRGLNQLETRQVSAPRPLFFGRGPEGWAVATAWLDDAVSAQKLWMTAGTVERQAQVISMVARHLGPQHARGVLQADMHLGNFMIRGEEVFALDPAMMRFARGPIGRRQSIRQVARLAAILSENARSTIESVFREYADARSWAVGPQDLEQLQTEHHRQRSKAIEKGLRKFQRTNRRHQEIRYGSWRGLADRKLLETANLVDLTRGLDEAMARGQILKDGGTSFVSRVTLGGVEVVIKRYNYKGLLHSLRHTLKGSRAKRSWLNANRLVLLGIATPQPLAYIEERRGGLLRQSYLITEFKSGQSLHQVLQDRTLPREQRQHYVEKAMRLMDRLATHNITHGDMKHTNILCHDDEVVLIDLDAMRVHRWRWTHQRKQVQDRDRFARDCQTFAVTEEPGP